METLVKKSLTASKEEVHLALPFVANLNEGHLKSPEDYKTALGSFLGKEVDIQLIYNLKQFSNWIDEEDKRLTLNNVL